MNPHEDSRAKKGKQTFVSVIKLHDMGKEYWSNYEWKKVFYIMWFFPPTVCSLNYFTNLVDSVSNFEMNSNYFIVLMTYSSIWLGGF